MLSICRSATLAIAFIFGSSAFAATTLYLKAAPASAGQSLGELRATTLSIQATSNEFQNPTAEANPSFEAFNGAYKIQSIVVALPAPVVRVDDEWVALAPAQVGDRVQILAGPKAARIEIIREKDHEILFTKSMREYFEDLGEGRAAGAGFSEKEGGVYWSEGSNGGGFSKTSAHLTRLADGRILMKIDDSSSYAHDRECEIYLVRSAP
ncbi:hypothetical protein EON83_30775 [bacterium]|nr:MAG: hypothetical protein EON83_30775 [bacterium]